MEHQVRCVSSTAEASKAVRQMDDAYGAAFVRGLSQIFLSGMSRLCIFVAISHPAVGVVGKPSRGTYYKANGSYMITQPLDYADWITTDWAKRTVGYSNAVKAAIGRIAKTRIIEAERQALLNLADVTAEHVASSPPDWVKPLKRVTFVYSDDSDRPTIHYGSTAGSALNSSGLRYIEIPPEKAFEAAQSLPPRPDNDLPGPVSLYKRGDESLHFYEAFPFEGHVTEHWGVAGLGGENRFHDYTDARHAHALIAGFKKAKRAEGFQAIPSSRRQKLIVEYDVEENFANSGELDFRHAAEDALHNLLGQTGLGHCDGGSSGQGTMEICLIVVDAKLAEKVVRKRLADSPFGNIRRIYVER